MSFVNLSIARKTMMAACLAHAEQNGWDMEGSVAEGKYYWSHKVWWPDMVRFILGYEVDANAIHKWGLFDKMDINKVGTTEVNKGAVMCASTHEIGELFKVHMANYVNTERLRL